MNLNAAIESLIAKVRTKHLSYQTEKTYAYWLRRYILFVRTAPAADSRRKVEMFLSHLARQDVAASTQNQAFQAILFFYKHVLDQELSDVDALRAKRPARIRHAPAREDVLRLLAQVKDRGGYPVRLIVHLLYGCGLRVNEPLNLRIKDVDIAASRIFIRDAKGGKDRVVAMPCALVEPLRAQLAVADGRWQLDRQNGVPVPLPGRLDKKSPRLAHSRSWYWLFPAHSPCRHPRTGQTVRYRCLETNIQRAVKDAARRIGLDGSISPHHLRHAYATHLLEGGVSPRAIQVAMGHVSLETTMGYLHADSTSVPSPLPAGGLTACYNQER